ncbi:LysR family transcriptional regulator [Bosea sp. 117]|uniref:LysR family transcriptional regulator n=1 Tax=Bosea sp. 117 TaxID=1125973 RepID=UPI00049429B4|nr:LysR family transcriptional regulator [Bosea sp. 117]
MNEMNFDWDDLRLFLAVARQGGLGPAAALTGKSAPTLGRRMLALERRLGQELFERQPRGYALTAQGLELLQRVAGLESLIAPLSSPARRAAPPLVKVSAGAWVTRLLCRHAAGLVDPGKVALRFIAADHVLDISRREAVIGIRNQRPDQIGLAGRRTGTVRFAAYAANDGITAWARVIGNTPSARWVRERTGEDAVIEVTNPRNALDLAVSGMARMVLPTFIGEAEAGLRRVSPPIEELEHEQWLVTHDEDRFLPEVRRTIDRVYAVMRAALV